jgi:hypothetical protein
LKAQGNPNGNSEIALYNSTVAQYFPNQVQNMDAFSEGSWVSCRVFTQALAKLGANVTRDGLVQALASGSCDSGGMAPTTNYSAACGSHAARHCAMYITCTSGHRWQPTVPDFVCA